MTIKFKIKNHFNSCPECNAPNSIIYNEDRAEETCFECGLVIRDKIFDTSIPDNRYYTKEEIRRRKQIGPPIPDHLSKIILPTKIKRTNDWNQNRIFKQQTWSSEKHDNINCAIFELHRICANLQVSSDIKNHAERLTIRALEKGLAKGRTVIGIVAACIFYACKKVSNITLDEIIGQIEGNVRRERCPRRHVYKCYTTLFRELDLHSHTIDPKVYIPRYVSDLSIDQKMVGLTCTFLQTYLPYLNSSGKDPKGIAAAALYIICCVHKVNIFQAKVAEIAGISDVTLRSRIKEFYAVLSR
jgi:transcription initiation factor TFIIB